MTELNISFMENNDKEYDDNKFDTPNNSKWVVAVDINGMVSVLSTPNIHPSFLDNGLTAENLGLPPDADCDAGVYEWTCSFSTSTDWESGVVDDYYFEPITEKLLWSTEK